MKRLASLICSGIAALLLAALTPGTLFAQAAGYGGGGGGGMGGGGGGSGGGSFGSSGSAFGSSGSLFGSSGSGFSASSGSGFGGSNVFTTNPGGAPVGGQTSGIIGMSSGGMYGGTGYAQPGAGRTGSNYSSSSQYGNRAGGAYGQAGGGQARAGGRGRGTGQLGQGQPGQGPGANKDQQAWFEPRIEVGFAITTPAPTAVQSDIVKPLRAPALAPRFGKVNVAVQGSTVVLRGTVNSEEDRALAAQMAMLEPSVFAVQNELQIAAPAANPPR